MKKIIMGAALAASLLSTQVVADIKGFVGVDVSRNSIDVKTTTTVVSGSAIASGVIFNAGDSISYTGDGADTTPVIKLGLIINDTHRAYIKYGSWEDEGVKNINTTLNYDYLVKLDSTKIVPFVGINAGYSKIEDDFEKITGSTYGIQAGAIYPIDNGFEIEFSVGYSGYNLDKTYTTPTINGTYSGVTFTNFVGSTKAEAESSTFISLGANYKF